MKKFLSFFAFTMMALIGLSSCSKDDNDSDGGGTVIDESKYTVVNVAQDKFQGFCLDYRCNGTSWWTIDMYGVKIEGKYCNFYFGTLSVPGKPKIEGEYSKNMFGDYGEVSIGDVQHNYKSIIGKITSNQSTGYDCVFYIEVDNGMKVKLICNGVKVCRKDIQVLPGEVIFKNSGTKWSISMKKENDFSNMGFNFEIDAPYSSEFEGKLNTSTSYITYKGKKLSCKNNDVYISEDYYNIFYTTVEDGIMYDFYGEMPK